ncbi:MAG: hypothetical protein KF851_06080 [Pirellulaceae bacterium]|nr:hypothetical protein [Pirellulaceae bacterium]
MAKKKSAEDLNVSQEIRSEYDKDSTQKPKVIADALSKRGVNVSAGYVSVILSKYRKQLGIKPKRRRRKGSAAASVSSDVVVAKRGRPAANKTSVSGGDLYADLRLVKELVAKTGSVERAREAINCFVELTK